MNKKPSLIVIVGPTASGKTDMALRVAKKFNGEIISADSRQVYKNLAIGTAKVSGGWKKKIYVSEGIPHFCIDVASPKKIFTAADFKTCARIAIAGMCARKKIPIIVGGTGFWVDTLLYDINLPHVPPNVALRKKLEKKSVSYLFDILKKVDPDRAAAIEQKNPRRLIRAIEIAAAIGHTPPMIKKNPYRALWIGVLPRKDILIRSIRARSRAMIRAGLVAETKKLQAKRVSKKRIREFGFEYAAALDVIEKKIPQSRLPEILARETIKYAKRQMRWFKRNADIHWVTTARKAEEYVKKFIAGRKMTRS